MKINTLSWTATNCTSMTAPLLPLPQDHFRTRSSHHPTRSTSHYARLCLHGQPETHYHLFNTQRLTIFGHTPFNNTTRPSGTTSPTRTFLDSNNNSPMPSSTMRTSGRRLFASSAQSYTTNAYQKPSPIPWFSRSWKKVRTTSLNRPSPTLRHNSANNTLGLLVLEKTFRTPMSSRSARNSSWLDDPL